MISAASTMEVKNLALLSTLFGSMEYRKVKNPCKDPTTGEVITKLIVLCDETGEIYKITVPGEIAEGACHKRQESDFEGCNVKWNTSGKKGFNPGEVGAVLDVAIKATEVVVKNAPSFPNKKENAESTKPGNKQAVEKWRKLLCVYDTSMMM